MPGMGLHPVHGLRLPVQGLQPELPALPLRLVHLLLPPAQLLLQRLHLPASVFQLPEQPGVAGGAALQCCPALEVLQAQAGRAVPLLLLAVSQGAAPGTQAVAATLPRTLRSRCSLLGARSMACSSCQSGPQHAQLPRLLLGHLPLLLQLNFQLAALLLRHHKLLLLHSKAPRCSSLHLSTNARRLRLARGRRGCGASCRCHALMARLLLRFRSRKGCTSPAASTAASCLQPPQL